MILAQYEMIIKVFLRVSQVILKPIVPHTQKDQVEYSVAAERRRVRMVHDDIISELLSHGSIQQGKHTATSHHCM